MAVGSQASRVQGVLNFIVIGFGRSGIQAGHHLAKALEKSGRHLDFKPAAMDHQPEDLVLFEAEGWKHVAMRRGVAYSTDIERIGREMGFGYIDWGNRVNREPADQPAVIRACTQLTFDEMMWEEFIYSELPYRGNSLPILITMFNPDGPTSGTASIQFMLSLRKTIDNLDPVRKGQLPDSGHPARFIRVGIELCTESPFQAAGNDGNIVCGAIRRQELLQLQAKPRKDPDRPFDILLVFDAYPAIVRTRGHIEPDDLCGVASYVVSEFFGGRDPDQPLVSKFMNDAQEPFQETSNMNLLSHARWELIYLRLGFEDSEVEEIRALDALKYVQNPDQADRHIARLDDSNDKTDLAELLRKWKTAADRLERSSQSHPLITLSILTRGRIERECKTAETNFRKKVGELIEADLQQFDTNDYMLRPFRIIPPFTDAVHHAILEDTEVFSALRDDEVEGIRGEIIETIKSTHMAGAQIAQKEAVHVYLNASWNNLRALTHDRLFGRAFEPFLAPSVVPKYSVMDSGALSHAVEVVIMVAPVGLDDVGQSTLYKEKLDQASEIDWARCIAFPECWPQRVNNFTRP